MAPESKIRKEYEGEPPSVVIQTYADLGYSQRAISQILHIHRETLRRMVKQYKIKLKPYKEMNDSCKGLYKR